jgi:hypothetical protein
LANADNKCLLDSNAIIDRDGHEFEVDLPSSFFFFSKQRHRVSVLSIQDENAAFRRFDADNTQKEGRRSNSISTKLVLSEPN